MFRGTPPSDEFLALDYYSLKQMSAAGAGRPLVVLVVFLALVLVLPHGAAALEMSCAS
jgi:hypothetical protein